MTVDVSIDGAVAIVRLNRPDKLNAINLEIRSKLERTWRDLAASDDVRAVVLTGAGDRAFSAGVDLSSPPPRQSAAAANFLRKGHISLVAAMQIPQPIICAVNGLAFGGGMEMVLGSDIILSVDTAEFALTEVRLGSLPGSGGTQLLPRMTSRSNAMRYLLTGDKMSAQEAHRIGVVSELCSAEDLMYRSTAIAARIAENAPMSVAAIKRLVREGASLPLAEAMQLERYAFGLLADSEDRAEGRAAFRDKRKPKFQGK